MKKSREERIAEAFGKRRTWLLLIVTATTLAVFSASRGDWDLVGAQALFVALGAAGLRLLGEPERQRRWLTAILLAHLAWLGGRAISGVVTGSGIHTAAAVMALPFVLGLLYLVRAQWIVHSPAWRASDDEPTEPIG